MTTLNRISFAFLCLMLLAMLSSRTGVAAVIFNIEVVDQQHVRLAVSNTGEQPVTFLRWGSPFEDQLTGNFLRIDAGTGQIASFRGRFIKRTAPLPEDFIELASGEQIDNTIFIPRYYQLPASGTYSISASWLIQEWAGSVLRIRELNTKTIVADLFKPPAIVAAQPPLFESCNESQQSVLQQALNEAENLTLAARDGLAGLANDARVDSPRYIQWFGAYSESRFNRVLSTYTRMAEVLRTQTVKFSCDCETSGWFAFVYPALEYDIYLCPAFWRANMIGRDSKAGTLIHELTHFPSVGGTADHAYSNEAANLRPELAVDNADNYEYFAENEPALPMSSDSPDLNEQPRLDELPDGDEQPTVDVQGETGQGELDGNNANEGTQPVEDQAQGSRDIDPAANSETGADRLYAGVGALTTDLFVLLLWLLSTMAVRLAVRRHD